ncbi:Fanconi anemia group J protein homolog [Tubulanus polymorphus]|uniref:Fanconi anemia group J protein homolog n=1 Tax=Tubulanus polymorphus TaxID=672921 RepID=UPI003DA29596
MSGTCGTESLEGCTRTVHGVNIKFPVKPYPSQMGMMAKIVKGLSDSVNCLLESPTGTGKSLALLCSSLAWQDSMAAKREKEILAMENCDEDDDYDYHSTEPKQCLVCGKRKKKQGFEDSAPSTSEPPRSTEKQSVTKEDILVTTGQTDEDDDLKDFKPASTVFKTPSNRQSLNREHVSIQYEDSNSKSTEENLKKVKEDDVCTCYSFKQSNVQSLTYVPTIYYATRTHRQIKQIANELVRTNYGHKRMTILSSRQHSCIHPRVSKEKNKNEGCRELLENSGCCYNDNAKKISHSTISRHGLQVAWDLEDLIDVCHTLKACPFFGARQLKDQAEIIFCPYNYLIDSSIRESMQLELGGQVIILDEAHNIEDAAREAASFKITLSDIQNISEQLNTLVEADINAEHCLPIIEMLNKLANFIDKKGQILDRKSFDQSSTIWTGREMVAVLESFNINEESLQILVTHFNKICDDLKNGDEDDGDEEEHPARRRPRMMKKKKAKFPQASQQILHGFFLVLKYLYTQNKRFIEDYRIAIVRTTSYSRGNTNNQWMGRGNHNYNHEVTHTFTLNFWCLSPAVAFSDLASARSIILTSGTLSPMQSFQSELGLSFPLQLEASHVIHNSQVWVGSISQGPRGTSLLTTYQNTETFSYQDEVGLLLLEICKIMPFGVLCFLPSYKMLEKLTNRWQTTGLWVQLSQQKNVMCEPRASDKMDFDEMISDYYWSIKQAETQGDDVKPNGALMFAVCRGKISEGIDFAHNNARAVITIGIPFPNVKDIQVNLKKEYNNRNQYRGLLSGNEWYEIQAYRALNQALGRCIRNRMDWGALILVDTRFGNQPERYMKGISKWVRTKASHYRNFGTAQSSLVSFTAERRKADAEGKKVELSLSPNSSILGYTPQKSNFNQLDNSPAGILPRSTTKLGNLSEMTSANKTPDFRTVKVDMKPSEKKSPPLSLETNSNSTTNNDSVNKTVQKLENSSIPMNSRNTEQTSGSQCADIGPKKDGIFQFVDLVSPAKPQSPIKTVERNYPNSPLLFGSDSNESSERGAAARVDTKKKLDFAEIELNKDDRQNIEQEPNVDDKEVEKENIINSEIDVDPAAAAAKSNTRRGKKRKWSNKGGKVKRGKSGVNYTTDSSDERDNDYNKSLVCKFCGNVLNKTSCGAKIRAEKLPFIAEMNDFIKRAVNPADDISVYDSISSLNGISSVTTLQPGLYNCYWSQMTQCCCRLFKCENCDEYMGVEVLSAPDENAVAKSKQVFVFPSVTVEST